MSKFDCVPFLIEVYVDVFTSIDFCFAYYLEKSNYYIHFDPPLKKYLTALTMPKADLWKPIVKNLNDLLM